jgi:hypothetical protein
MRSKRNIRRADINKINQGISIHFLDDVDVIEITDCDDDKPTQNGQSTSIVKTPVNQTGAGPSRRPASLTPPGPSHVNMLPDSLGCGAG